MAELGDIFAELGISQYLQDFIDQGFDTWETILDITEPDFDALGVKLGHRRKLQRKIANSRGLSSDRALASPSRTTPTDDRQAEDQTQGRTKNEGTAGTGTQGAKRKYRRHPKLDENAPERQPSAYVIFSNKMREELKGRNLSFTEIAKLVGENWQNLSPVEKEPYEQQAFSAKEIYNNELAAYKKTNQYKEYSHYLADFKARQSNQHQVSDVDTAKRPKLKAHLSTASSGTASSDASQHSDNPTSRVRIELSASNTSPRLTYEGQNSPQLNGPTKFSAVNGVTKTQCSPVINSPQGLPGCRNSIFSGAHQTFASREGQRDDGVPAQQLRRKANSVDRQSGYTGPPVMDPYNLTGSLQLAHCTGQGHPPPLLSSGSTAGRSSASSGSNTSIFYNPSIPMEPALDRALPIPTLHPQKSSSSFDNQLQLPPLRPHSLSPQTSILGPTQSPNEIHPVVEYPSSMALMRGYARLNMHQALPGDNNGPRTLEYMSTSSLEDSNLDPVSALLKAGEIVDRSSRNRPPS